MNSTMFNTKKTALAIAVGLLMPLWASAQSATSSAPPSTTPAANPATLAPKLEELMAELYSLQARIEQLEADAKAQQDAGGPIDKEEFYRIKTKAEALEDQKEAGGFKGLKVSGGIDPSYIYSRDKNSSSFAFLNNFANVNGSGEQFSYDNSFIGVAYLDFQKEMEGGVKWRLTLAPSKSASSGYNVGSIVHEASASIPLSDAQTRLIVGQMPDMSGYDFFFHSVNQNHLITHDLLFDFTQGTFYTGAGLDLIRGPWEFKAILANFNTTRNDINNGSLKSPTLIYNASYTKEEFWGFEFTGYEGKVANLQTGGYNRLDQFEIDGNYTRGNTNANLQLVVGQQAKAAYNGGDARWYGFSALLAQKLTTQLEGVVRLDYLNNSKNGGGTINVGGPLAANSPLSGQVSAATGTAYVGDFINGFGPGNPDATGFDPNRGANRYALSLGLNYLMGANVSLRAELRYDGATLPTFYDYKDGSFKKDNQVLAVSTIVSF